MKKTFNLLFAFSLISITVSCGSDSPSEDSPELSQYVLKHINATTDVIIDSTTYTLSNNKIISSEGINIATSQGSNSEYTYTEGKISTIFSYVNSILRNKQFYEYQDNKLSELRTESYSSTSALTQITKHTFEHTSDTIFSEWKRSTDGINYNLILSSKMRIVNSNRVFYESYDPINDETDRVLMNFDASGNPLIEEHFLKQDGAFVPTLTNTMSYSSGKNSFGKIMEETYGRRTLMLLYHIQSNAINDFIVKSLSKNTIDTFASSFDSTINFTVQNIINAQNYAQRSEYTCTVSGSTYSKFQQDFYFN